MRYQRGTCHRDSEGYRVVEKIKKLEQLNCSSFAFIHPQQVFIFGFCSQGTSYRRRDKPQCPFRMWECSPRWEKTPYKAHAIAAELRRAGDEKNCYLSAITI